MVSAIDREKPTSGHAYTADVRSNFGIAADEISALQDQIAALQADVATLKARTMAAVSTLLPSPPGTTSTAYVVAAAVAFTGGNSTRSIVLAEGQIGNTMSAKTTQAQLCYGTGPAPIIGSLVSSTTGELIDSVISMVSSRANDFTPFGASTLLSDLVPGALYWFGIALLCVDGGSAQATLSQLSLTAFEVLDPLT